MNLDDTKKETKKAKKAKKAKTKGARGGAAAPKHGIRFRTDQRFSWGSRPYDPTNAESRCSDDDDDCDGLV